MKLGIYKHYKGKYYKVVGISIHTETEETLVLYETMYDTPDLTKKILEKYNLDKVSFVRPYSMFFETIEKDGKKVPRFEYIGERIKV